MSGHFDKGYYSMGNVASRHVAQRDKVSHSRLKLRRQPGKEEEGDKVEKLKRLRLQLEKREKGIVEDEKSEAGTNDRWSEKASRAHNDSDESDQEGSEEEKFNASKEAKSEKQSSAAAALPSNPLLEGSESGSSSMRRWDDDVMFRSKPRASQKPSEKRFVNDIIQSDKHKSFMRKFIK